MSHEGGVRHLGGEVEKPCPSDLRMLRTYLPFSGAVRTVRLHVLADNTDGLTLVRRTAQAEASTVTTILVASKA